MEKKVVFFGFIIIVLFFASILILDQFPVGGSGQSDSEITTEVGGDELATDSSGGFELNINIFDILREELGVYHDENGNVVVEDRTSEQSSDTVDNTEVEEQVSQLPDSDGTVEGGTSSNTVVSGDGCLEVHFIDIGQGNCTLVVYYNANSEIECSMLIDTGYYEYGTKVQNYIQKLGISKLDYIIGTHPDSDHIGAMDVIITKFDCGTILLPEYQRDDVAAWDFMKQAMDYKYYTYTVPTVGTVYTFGGANFTILGPSKVYEECNDNSIVIRMDYGDTSFLFGGDAEEVAETDMVNSGYNLACDVYQVSHHGSNTSTSQAFLDAVSPVYAVISCAEGNDYFHPHGSVLNRLRSANVQVFRTDEQGSIVCTSDGSSLSWNCAPSTTWQAGEGAN